MSPKRPGSRAAGGGKASVLGTTITTAGRICWSLTTDPIASPATSGAAASATSPPRRNSRRQAFATVPDQLLRYDRDGYLDLGSPSRHRMTRIPASASWTIEVYVIRDGHVRSARPA